MQNSEENTNTNITKGCKTVTKNCNGTCYDIKYTGQL